MAKAKSFHFSSDEYPLNVSSTEIYSVSEPCRGYAVIINNFRFSNEQLNIDDAEDATQKLTETFEKMKFKVKSHHNVNAHEMLELMRSYSKEDQRNYGCFMCVLLSHGSGDGICGSDGLLVPVMELLNKVVVCESLKGKPKLFFIDACSYLFEPFHVSLSHKYHDVIICSTQADNLDYMMEGHEWKCSIMFKALCNVIRQWGEKAEMNELLSKLQMAVQESSNQIQTTEIQDGLKKKCFFTPGWRICKHCKAFTNTALCTKCMFNERPEEIHSQIGKTPHRKQYSSYTNFNMKSEDQNQNRELLCATNETARPLQYKDESQQELKRFERESITSENYQLAQEIVTSPGEVGIAGKEENNETRIVIVGRTGAGKSATGNFILGETFFESKLTGDSVTQECKRGIVVHSGMNMVIVDTPGLFDTKLSHEKLSKEIIRCIHMSIPGPHVFLLVVQIARFTNEEIESFNRLFDLFGEKLGKFAIVAFTRLDDLTRDNSTIEEYIKHSPKILTKFLERCNGRFIGLDNNVSSVIERNAKLDELLRIITDLLKENAGQHYTNIMYKEAEETLRQKILLVKKKEAEEREREIAKITSQYSRKTEYLQQQNKALEMKVAESLETREAYKRDREKTKAEINKLKETIKETNENSKKELYAAKQREMKEKENHMAEIKLVEKQTDFFLQQLEGQKRERMPNTRK